VLEAGDEAQIDRDGLTILNALSDARLLITRDHAPLEVQLRVRAAQAALAAH
jgi:hypothetical protein